ncbi:MAG TPA: peptide chain release factor N(5)-glutamine methyltransferase [Candidatus Saccharimonadales bacterium]|jgi:release factor glutamine methyltransferase
MEISIANWLVGASKQLETAGIETARLDCLVLLEDCLNTNRTQLLAHPERELDIEQIKWLSSRLKRRTKHEPLAYIRGKTEFYGREFIVNKHVLEPRPESEAMIDLLKAATLPANPRIADIGAGSGCLGITAKLELPHAQADLIEVDEPALAAAKKNVNKFSINATCIKNDLLARISTKHDVILANLPYVPNNFHINLAAQAEPRFAIFGGADGLDVYRRLFSQIKELPWQPSFIFTESLPPQHAELAAIANSAGFKLVRTEDFIQQLEPK